MPQQIMQYLLAQQTLNLELLYSFVIILCSLMIYFGTKELYELSQYKGIKYFRLSFLFFAIAYFFRPFIKFIFVYFDATEIIRIAPREFTLWAFMYFSLIAIFYLLYSVMWKEWNHEQKTVYIFHAIAATIALICILFHNSLVHLSINIFILAIAFATVILASKNKRPKSNYIYLTYILLAIFWTLNIVDILTPNILQNTQIAIYLASVGIFLTILYRVVKNTGSN